MDVLGVPRMFRERLLIDRDGGPAPFGSVMDPWQAEDFGATDAPWLRAMGVLPDDAPGGRAWLERPRGHSKTSDAAVMVACALALAPARITGVAAAADGDQAALLRKAIQTLCDLNPWLAAVLEVKHWKVTNRQTGSELTIISADAASSFGLLVDFIIVDELTHWGDAGEALWHSLFSTAGKRRRTLLLVITNAGTGKGESWQWKARESARTSPGWHFHALPGPVASWITPEALDEQRRMLPYVVYQRLWLNLWTTGSGDAIPEEQIQRALTADRPLALPEPGWLYFAGLDLGLSRDASALAVVGLHVGWTERGDEPEAPPVAPVWRVMADLGLMAPPPAPQRRDVLHAGTGRLRLADLRVWRPGPGRKVSLSEVEDACRSAHSRFRLSGVAADQWQAALLVERLQAAGIPAWGIEPTAPNLKGMAAAVLEAFSEGLFDLYPDPDLLHDLRNLKAVEKGYGVRLESPRGPMGHGDAATALALSLLATRGCRSGVATVPGELVVA